MVVDVAAVPSVDGDAADAAAEPAGRAADEGVSAAGEGAVVSV